MYLFILSVFPISLINWFIFKKNRNMIPFVFIGSLCAILTGAYRTFFLISHNITFFAPKDNFVDLLLHQTLLPIIILSGLFLIFSRDKIEYKLQAFYPITASFYMIYMPYIVLSNHKTAFSAFELFVIPVIFVFMIYTISELILLTYKSLKNHKNILMAIYITGIFIYLFTPAFLQVLFIYNTRALIVYGIFLIYIAIPIFFTILKAIYTGALK